MSFIAKSHPENPVRDEVASGNAQGTASPPAAGDTYLAALLMLIDLGTKARTNYTLLEQARNCCSKRNQSGLHLALEMFRANCDDLRKRAAEIENKCALSVDAQMDADLAAIRDGDLDAATETYGSN